MGIKSEVVLWKKKSEEKEETILSLKQKVSALTDECEGLKARFSELQSYKETCKVLEKDKVDLEKSLKAQEAESQKSIKELKQSHRVDIEGKDEEIEGLMNESKNFRKKLEDAENKFDGSSNKMKELKATLDRIAAEKIELEVQVEENSNRLKHSKEETDEQINQLKSTSEEATCKLLKVQEKEKAHMKHRLELASKLSSALND